MTHELLLSTRLSFRIWVSLEPRNGMCVLSLDDMARRTSFSARRLVLISAPSMRVALENRAVSAPRSLPAGFAEDRRTASVRTTS
jgi:hypothetical protein